MCEDRICTEMELPAELREKAAADAIAENPDNLIQFSMLAPIARVGLIPDVDRMAVLTSKRWARGRKLKVSFMGGEPTVIAKIKSVASEWEKYANIKFDWVAQGGEIRISFDSGSGSWSYLGTDALQIANNRATMNFGWLTPNSNDQEYSRVVLHEFGHALGCIHEHMHPDAGIPWDKPKVYDYYYKTAGWDKVKVDNNIFKRYEHSSTNFSNYDRLSIMHYAVPNSLTLGDFEVGWNRVLSESDKAFIGSIY